ncbi:VOC family protein [Clostridium sp. 'White wine YQ']|uniref:VOC family protein n=1 Tax=Clostridium sp. 'White wine YQ' TaxID=3027474 RepID=UPI002365DEFB|nr:VOC family protein [Clostridium sp. 'White wine YQ']MDD7794457.1 VOC family protein [Clostridium sp. 'White wine YQ']
MNDTNSPIIPFLTFSGNADEAMNFYVSIFPDSKILELTRVGENVKGEEGGVLHGSFEIKGQRFMAMDVDKSYHPDFTWAMSLYIDCVDEMEFNSLFKSLSHGGKVLMRPESVLTLMSVAWVTDRFGVTWQLVLK